MKQTDPAVLQYLNSLIAATIGDGFIEASLAAHGVMTNCPCQSVLVNSCAPHLMNNLPGFEVSCGSSASLTAIITSMAGLIYCLR